MNLKMETVGGDGNGLKRKGKKGREGREGREESWDDVTAAYGAGFPGHWVWERKIVRAGLDQWEIQEEQSSPVR